MTLRCLLVWLLLTSLCPPENIRLPFLGWPWDRSPIEAILAFCLQSLPPYAKRSSHVVRTAYQAACSSLFRSVLDREEANRGFDNCIFIFLTVKHFLTPHHSVGVTRFMNEIRKRHRKRSGINHVLLYCVANSQQTYSALEREVLYICSQETFPDVYKLPQIRN